MAKTAPLQYVHDCCTESFAPPTFPSSGIPPTLTRPGIYSLEAEKKSAADKDAKYDEQWREAGEGERKKNTTKHTWLLEKSWELTGRVCTSSIRTAIAHRDGSLARKRTHTHLHTHTRHSLTHSLVHGGGALRFFPPRPFRAKNGGPNELKQPRCYAQLCDAARRRGGAASLPALFSYPGSPLFGPLQFERRCCCCRPASGSRSGAVVKLGVKACQLPRCSEKGRGKSDTHLLRSFTARGKSRGPRSTGGTCSTTITHEARANLLHG